MFLGDEVSAPEAFIPFQTPFFFHSGINISVYTRPRIPAQRHQVIIMVWTSEEGMINAPHNTA
jgi:hypothetical protein